MQNLDIRKNVLLLRNGLRYFLTPEEENNLKKAIHDGEVKFDVQGAFITYGSIDGIFKPADIDAVDKIKRGWWQCKYGKWHTKIETCKCGFNKLTSADDIRKKYGDK